jgi:hypothetical protein
LVFTETFTGTVGCVDVFSNIGTLVIGVVTKPEPKLSNDIKKL